MLDGESESVGGLARGEDGWLREGVFEMESERPRVVEHPFWILVGGGGGREERRRVRDGWQGVRS